MELDGIFTAQAINIFKGMIPADEREKDHSFTVQSIRYRLLSLALLGVLSPKPPHDDGVDLEEWIDAPLNITHLRRLLEECEGKHGVCCNRQPFVSPTQIMLINVEKNCLERCEAGKGL